MPYAAIRIKVNQKDIPARLPPLIAEVRAWLEKNAVAPAGPPFFLYRWMDCDREMVAEVGLPVNDPLEAGGYVFGDAFPAAYYAVMQYSGNYRNIQQGHRILESWLKKAGQEAAADAASGSICWGHLAEFYFSDPEQEPVASRWKAEIIYRLH